jgi:hypothetical protein
VRLKMEKRETVKRIASAFARTMMTRVIAVGATLALAATTSADIIDRIMAVVGGQPVTLSDVNGAMQFQLVPVPPGAADPVGTALDRLIERTLMLAEVDRFQPPEPDPSEITTRVEAIERRAGAPAAFEKMLSVSGMTREQLRRFIRDDLRIATYLNQRFGSATAPADRQAAIVSWAAELRRRADVSVLYQGRGNVARSSARDD